MPHVIGGQSIPTLLKYRLSHISNISYCKAFLTDKVDWVNYLDCKAFLTDKVDGVNNLDCEAFLTDKADWVNLTTSTVKHY